MVDRIQIPSDTKTHHRTELQPRLSKDNASKMDDLIVSLAGAYENKRERQIFEWERLRRERTAVGSPVL